MKHDEFRVKDIAGNDNQIVYELEHEVRTLRHPGFVGQEARKTRALVTGQFFFTKRSSWGSGRKRVYFISFSRFVLSWR